MKIHEFKDQLWLPSPPEEIFPFFAEAANLQKLTPPFLHFKILTPSPIQMGVGTLINYKLKIRGFPIKWQSKITVWNPPHDFTDEQTHGPYRVWIHRHTFEPANTGTLTTDHVRYAPIGGSLINFLFVRRDIKKIFAYRSEELKKIFPKT
jgi:ligand-binding SRPBCC domain-containing protein